MIFINPPFGNYLTFQNTISIKGSYTLEPRPGLVMQVLKTLRYSFEHSGWINKIGLRNPGIDYALKNYTKNTIISVAILEKEDIPVLVNKIPDNVNIELNISCPNAEKKMVTQGIEKFLNPKRKWCIVKLSPTTDLALVDSYYRQGFRQFHCSNTFPTKYGGLSGPFLISHSTKLIGDIRERYKDATIIGGGGIKGDNEIRIYKQAGADHFSVSTLFFNPYRSYRFYKSNIQR